MENSSSYFGEILVFNVSSPALCYAFPNVKIIVCSFTLISIPLLLISFYILYYGFCQWKQQRISSHTDHFTYHMAAMESITIFGFIVYNIASFLNMLALMGYSFMILATTWSFKVQFNSLTCIEQYLAVVHPITYLGLKQRGGVKMRNISIGCLWLLCFAGNGVYFVSKDAVVIQSSCLMFLSFIIVTFCCISVICALIRPSPAKEGGHKVDQSKRRALETMVLIFGTQLFAVVGMLVCEFVGLSETGSEAVNCAVLTGSLCFSLPSSLVLPLRFLQRVLGKKSCCK